MKTLLVTGAAGFIGSHLCEKLLNMGHRVIGVDDMSNGSMKNVQAFSENENFIFHFMNVSVLEYYVDFLDSFKIDAVFHLAANSDISVCDPTTEFRHTFMSTYSILEYCRDKGIKEFIFSSSGSVYGETTGMISELYGPLVPISHYAAAKLSSEAFISAYSHMYGIKSWILRFPNVVGGHATHGAIYDFVRMLRKNPDVLEVLGDGSQRKPYLYVKDLVSAIMFLWEKTGETVNLFNIAGTGETTVKEIANEVVEAMGTNATIIYTGGDRGWLGDVPKYSCDAGKLKKLGWKNEYDSLSSVKKAIKDIIHETEI
jgi:UDP-glucose 4-epimerase